MNSDTNSPTPIDPQLTGNPAGLTVQSLTVLPTRRAHDDAEADDDDGERNVGSEKRQKLNLWKCTVLLLFPVVCGVSSMPSFCPESRLDILCYYAGFAKVVLDSDSAR